MEKVLITRESIVVSFLEELVHQRFTKEELNRKLTDYFSHDIKVSDTTSGKCHDDLSDNTFIFEVELLGDFDIYFLPTREKKIYVTEVGYEFQ